MVRRTKKKIIVIILILISIIFIIPTIFFAVNKNKLEVSEQKIYNVVDLIRYIYDTYVEEVKIEYDEGQNFVVDDEKYKVKVKLNKEKNAEYEVIYQINDEEEKNAVDNGDGIYNISFDFENEQNNKCKIRVLKNNNEIYNWNKDIMYIKSIQKQFLSEFENNGITVHLSLENFDVDKTIKLLKSIGINNVRVEIKWQSIGGQNADEYNFDYCDPMMESFKKNGIKPIVILGAPNSYFGESDRMDSEEDVRKYLKYIKGVVEHYDWVENFEIMNEPNGKYGDDEGTTWYAKAVQEAKKIIGDKNVYAGATVLTGSEKFLTDISKKGAYDSSDYYSFHLYDWNKVPTVFNEKYNKYLTSHKEMINDIGGFQKLAITETGISNYIDGGAEGKKKDEYLIQQSVLRDKYDISSAYIYNFRNTNTDESNMEQNFGIVESDYTPKSSVYALKTFYENTNGAEYIGNIKLGDDLEFHIYDKDGKPKAIVWSNLEKKEFTLDYNGFQAKDIYGNIIKKNEDEKLIITNTPIYLDNISYDYFYQAIYNNALDKLNSFKEKYYNEINGVEDIKNSFESLEEYINTLSTKTNENENTAIEKMQEVFEIGNKILDEYENGILINVEPMKISSMLDSLNNIADSLKDLVIVTAKTKISDFSAEKNDLDKIKQFLQTNQNIDLTYPTKIYNVANELFEKANYINGLDDQNDIKIGMVSGIVTQSIGLANWTMKFINIEIQKQINPIIDNIESKINNFAEVNESLLSNDNVNNSIKNIQASLLNLKENSKIITEQDIMQCFYMIYDAISTISTEYYSGVLKDGSDNIADKLVYLEDISSEFEELLRNFITQNNIDLNNVKNNLNNAIIKYQTNQDKYNLYLPYNLLNKATELYNNDLQTDDYTKNYLSTNRILKIAETCSNIIDAQIKIDEFINEQIENTKIEYSTLNLTNNEVKVIIETTDGTNIINNSGKNEYLFNKNGTFEFVLNTNNIVYKIKAEVNWIINDFKIVDNYFIGIDKNTSRSQLDNKLKIKNYKITRSEKDLQNSENIISGDILNYNGNDYFLIVNGDIDSDGDVTVSDLIYIRAAILDEINFNELESVSADINTDKSIDVLDLIYMRNLILK